MMQVHHQMGDDRQPTYGSRAPVRAGTDELIQDPNIDRAIANLENLPTAATRDELRLETRRRHRSDLIIVVCIGLMVLVAYLFSYLVARNAIEQDTRLAIIATATRSLDKTNDDRAKRGLAALSTDTTFDPNNDDAVVQALAAAVAARIETDPQFRSEIPSPDNSAAMNCPGGKSPGTVTVTTPNGKIDLYACR